ncbi:MAG: HEAT repeat domain-containing protein [Elusimicrobia bacterium]|nr:HEAT repeat domain-containing protein [Elusimicrobiota bacterium]
MRAALLAAVLGALAHGAPAPADELALAGIDVYRSPRLTVEEATKRYGRRINELVGLKGRRRGGAERAAEQLRRRVEEEVRRDWGFAWVRLSWSDYYVDGAHKAFVTIDVVEPKDRAARMSFKPAPGRALGDPGGLLADWGRYSELGWKLLRKGEVASKHETCLSLYCEWGAQTPELRAFEERFVSQVQEHKQALLQVLRLERDPAKRARAVLLLGYLQDGNESAKLIAEALDDPAVEVRSAALRVYADYAVYHQDVFLPVTKIEAALDYPEAEDRSKAMAVVAGMASNRVHRRFLIMKMGAKILQLLESPHPATQDTAYAALGILSKEAYDRRDVVSWKRWLERARAEEAASESAGSE